MNGISRFLQNLLKCFNCTTIFKFAIPELLVLSVILDLNLNDLESSILISGSYLKYYHKLADLFSYF